MQESRENYLETILRLSFSVDNVRAIDIARELNYSKASVSRALTLLKEDDSIIIDEHGYITFTEKGEMIANDIMDKHRTLASYFRDILHIDSNVAEIDACKIEHVISEETFSAIKKHLSDFKESKK